MTASCPFCNHRFEAEVTPRSCPRCGEFLRAADPEEASTRVEYDLGSMVKRRVKRAVLVALAIMAVAVAVAVWKVRSEREPQITTAPPPAATDRVTAPLELRGLAYLPPRANVVFAIQPGPALVHAEKTGQDPVTLFTRNRVPGSALGSLAKAGITLQQIDHVVGGVFIPDRDETLQLAVAVVLRGKLADEKAFLDALKAVPAPNLGPNRFTVSFGNFAMHAFHAADEVWVFGLGERDIGAESKLATDLRDTIEARAPKDSAVWAAASGDKWHEKPLMAFLGKDALAPLSKTRAAAVGYSFGETPTLTVAVRGANAGATRTRFRGLATGERSIAGGEADWATLSRPVEPAAAFDTLRRTFDE